MWFAYTFEAKQKGGEPVSAIAVANALTYVNYRDEDKHSFYACPDEIDTNSVPDGIDINEVRVCFKKQHRRTSSNGIEHIVRPHFFISPEASKQGIKSKEESEEHKQAKEIIYQLIQDKTIKFKLSDGNYFDYEKFFDETIFEKIKIKEHVLEFTDKIKRIDVFLPFKAYNQYFGHGIAIEIQFSSQTQEEENQRSLNYAVQSYSVCWLKRKDFNWNKNKDHTKELRAYNLEIKDNELKIHSFTEIVNTFLNNKFLEIKSQTTKYLEELELTTQKIERRIEVAKESLEEAKTSSLKEIEKTSLQYEYRLQQFEDAIKIHLTEGIVKLSDIEQRIERDTMYPPSLGECECKKGFYLRRQSIKNFGVPYYWKCSACGSNKHYG